MATFTVEIITPHEIVLKKELEKVILRTVEGDMGILANHAPFVSELALGEMKLVGEGYEERFFVSGGFLEISREKTLVLADEAINVKDIDLVRAKKEAEEAKAKLAKLKEEKDIAMTQKALQDALTKVRLAER
jgi:F-type H+-transporting ATPase subunit epsilon